MDTLLQPVSDGRHAEASAPLWLPLRCPNPWRAGVPVESRLLPSFVQLLLQGPPLQQWAAGKAAAGSFVGDGGSSTRQQQQLLEWRQQRQARLLAVHSQLAELPHALETLT